MIALYKRNYIRFIGTFIFALFLGLVITICIMQNDPWVKSKIEDMIMQDWSKKFKCNITCKILSVNLFKPCIRLETLSMKAHDNSWEWNTQGVSLGFGWFDLILSGGLDIYMDIDDITVESLISSGKLSIQHHIVSMLQGPPFIVPIFFKSCEIKKGILRIKELQSDLHICLPLSIILKNIDGVYKSKIICKEGHFCAYGKQWIEHFSGPLVFNVTEKAGNLHAYVESNCTFEASFIPGNKTCFLYGTWNYDQGLFCIKNQDRSFVIDPIKVYFLADSLFVSLDIDSDIKNIAAFFDLDESISGRCSCEISSEFRSFLSSKRGRFIFSDIAYNGVSLFSLAELSFNNTSQPSGSTISRVGQVGKSMGYSGGGNKNKEIWHGSLSIIRDDGISIQGKCRFDQEKKRFVCDLYNDSDIAIPLMPYWKIGPKQSKINITYDAKKNIDIMYSFLTTSSKLDANVDISGVITISGDVCQVKGNINEKRYTVLVDQKKYRIKECSYTDKDDNILFSLEALKNDVDKLKGKITFPLIQTLVKEYFNYDITGDGNIDITCALKEDSVLCKLLLKDGSISLPNQYNFLNGFTIIGKFDPKNRFIFIKDMRAQLHKGTITCSKAVIDFEQNYKPKFIYAPFLFENCLINSKNDLFALVSGRCILSKKQNDVPCLKGLIFIDKSQLKSNIFASQFQKTFSGSQGSVFESDFKDMICDISVISKDPIRINTSFLQASANLDVTIKKNIFNPEISGKIDFISGSMSFPYKPLYISKGSLYFLPQQDDPIIEIVAKNKINKYNITLYVTGSLLKNNISLESAPTLSEEQIVSLLIAGSAQESMNSVMPALIMQNITNLIFGSDHSKAGVGKYFKRIFKPFKNIYIVPSFADQTGRGGLRGSIEIDINERWKAFVQKNFSLSEDTRFEIEYLLSDDVSVRGVRAENGDIGGEIEMKWKF